MFGSYGNSEVVAPISAPMLQIVPLPVAEIESAPGPWYSMIAPVPPSTVRMRATSRITSLGLDQPDSEPREAHADDLRPAHVEREPGHHVDGVSPADADGDHPEATGVGRVRVGADHHPAREGVVLQDDLMDDPAARAPEPDPVARRDGAQELVDLGVGVDRHAEIDRRPDLGLDQMVAVHRRGSGDLGKPGGHELQQRHLGGGVLHRHTIGSEVGVALAAFELLAGRIGEVVDEDLLGERERTAEPLPPEGDAFGQRCVDTVRRVRWGWRPWRCSWSSSSGPALAIRADIYNSNTSAWGRPTVRRIRYREIADALRRRINSRPGRVVAAQRVRVVGGVRRQPGDDSSGARRVARRRAGRGAPGLRLVRRRRAGAPAPRPARHDRGATRGERHRQRTPRRRVRLRRAAAACPPACSVSIPCSASSG